MSLALVAEAAAGLLVLGVLGSWFFARERAGDGLTALHFVLVIEVLDAALFPQGGTSTGIFVLPINNRTTGDLFLLMPALLFLRWLAGRTRLRWSTAGIAWLAFFGWLVVEAVAGKINGNSSSAITQELKVLVMLGGAALLVAGVEARDLVGRRGIPLAVRWASPIAVVLTVTSLAKIHTNSSFGLFRGADTGTLGADAASVFASLGLLGLCVALAAPPRHRQGLLPSGVLIVAPAFTGQRASLLGAAAALVMIAVVPLVSRRHRVLRWRPSERVTTGLIVVAVIGVLGLAGATGHGINPSKTKVATSFTSQGKADSAQSRKNQWKVSTGLIQERPWLGWGLGKQYGHWEKIEDAPMIYQYNDLTHDIFLDELLRGGVVGMGLMVIAFGASAAAGLRAAWTRRSPRVVALGLAATAVIVEMVTRGTVESVFEKERLSVIIGLAVGIACSAARSTPRRRPGRLSDEPLTVPDEWLPSDRPASAGSGRLVAAGPIPRQVDN